MFAFCAWSSYLMSADLLFLIWLAAVIYLLNRIHQREVFERPPPDTLPPAQRPVKPESEKVKQP
jgi:Na+-transporting methylmalonyl-CoA/oxaloacetate decarboxylase gamma subunit